LSEEFASGEFSRSSAPGDVFGGVKGFGEVPGNCPDGLRFAFGAGLIEESADGGVLGFEVSRLRSGLRGEAALLLLEELLLLDEFFGSGGITFSSAAARESDSP
jgi:hypothetical protein